MCQISKKIHYCWFGGNPLPENAKKCIESWKKFCPDYEIIEWNESNFNLDECKYARQAYDAKKWAFVSDYARFKILYENGGLYFDTDVELIKSIDDIISLGEFMGVEDKKEILVAPGLGMAMQKGSLFCKEMVDRYMQNQFVRDDGSYNTETIVSYTTKLLKEYGLKKQNVVQQIKDIYIYPDDYFNPKDYITGNINITKNTRSIHHFDGSWFSDEERYAQKLKGKFYKILPKKLCGHVACFLAECKYRGIKGAIKSLNEKRKRKRGK